jgi:hypothetical protein
VPFKSYTSCVRPGDYHDLYLTAAEIGAGFALLSGGIGAVVAVPAAMALLEETLRYMLKGKLVCLGGDRCAVGTLIGFETTADKSFPSNIDNDFSMNLMLWPFSLQDFIGKTKFADSLKAVQLSHPQGCLVTEQSGMPNPHESPFGPKYQPDPVSIDMVDAYAIGDFNTMVPLTGPIDVAAFHCECEGSRISDMLNTLEAIGSLGTGGGLCEWKLFGIPIGSTICAVVETVLAPVVAIALTAAWFNATDGSPDDARLDPRAGELKLGNVVVITGRWSYDAGHTGWNELHPVKTIQKIAETPAGLDAGGDNLYLQWCGLTSAVPPPDRDGPDGTPASMTPSQQQTWDAQQRPENQWQLHPLVDGCQPPEHPPLIR